MKLLPTLFAALLLVLPVSLPAQTNAQAQKQLESARHKEVMDGDLKGAIAAYQAIARRYSKDRSVVAEAMLHIAQCHEKLGEGEARKIYEQIVRDFGDQGSAVTARARLAELTRARGSLTTRRIAARPEWYTGVPSPISPDGRYLFYANRDSGQWNPAILDLVSGEVRSIAKAPGLRFLDTGVISADNQMLVYTGQRAAGILELIVADMNGQNPRTVLKASPEVGWVYPIGITPDKKSVVIRFNRLGGRGYHLGKVDLATGVTTTVREFTEERLGQARLSPDGQWIVFAHRTQLGNPNSDISVVHVNGGRETSLVEHAADDNYPVWTGDGKGILFTTNRRGTIDLCFAGVNDGKPTGLEKTVKRDMGNMELFGASPSGSLVYRHRTGSVNFLRSTFQDATGKFGPFATLDEAFSGVKLNPQLSPDEKYLAYVRRPDYNWHRAIIGIRDLSSGKEREVYPNVSMIQYVMWMPDQRSFLVTGRDFNDELGDFIVDAQTGATRRTPTTGDTAGYSRGGGGAVVSPDGKTLYCPMYRTGNGALFAKDLETGAMRLLFEASGFVNAPYLSPDGRWLAYMDNGPDHQTGRLYSITDGSFRDLPEGLSVHGWTRDSRSMFVLSRKDFTVSLDRKTILLLRRMPLEGGEPVPVTDPFDYSFGDSNQILGNTIVFRDNRQQLEIWAMDGLLNLAN